MWIDEWNWLIFFFQAHNNYTPNNFSDEEQNSKFRGRKIDPEPISYKFDRSPRYEYSENIENDELFENEESDFKRYSYPKNSFIKQNSYRKYDNRNLKKQDEEYLNKNTLSSFQKEKKFVRNRLLYDEGDRAIRDKKHIPLNNSEIIFGIYPSYLAMKSGRRKINNIYVNEKSALKNDLILEVVSHCRMSDIPVNICDNRKINSVVGGVKVHQGVCMNVTPLNQMYLDINDISDNRIIQEDNINSFQENIDNENSTTNSQSDNLSSEPPNLDGNNSITNDFRTLNNKTSKPKLWIYLDRILDPMNIGAIMRTAYYFGVEKILVPEYNR